MASARSAIEEERDVFAPFARTGEEMSPEAPFPEREEVIGAEDHDGQDNEQEESMTEEEMRRLYAKANIHFSENGVVLKKLKNSRRNRQGKVRPSFGFGSKSPPVNFTEPPITSMVRKARTAGEHPKNYELSRRALVQKLRAADYWLRVLHPPYPQLHPAMPSQPSGDHFQVEAGRNAVTEERQEEAAAASDGRLPRSPLSERREKGPPASRLRHLSEESTALDPLWSNTNRQQTSEDASAERAAQSEEAFDNWFGDFSNWDKEAFERFAIGDMNLEPDSFFSTMDV